MQVCSLRWLGFIPEDLTAAPGEAIAVLAEILDVPARAIFDYSVRPQTRREHRPQVRAHAGFVAPSQRTVAPVREWLIDRAMEHERPSLLLSELWAELRRRRIERPAVAEAIRLVAWARERAHEVTFSRLEPQLTDALRSVLDGLLETEDGRSKQAWLRARPTTVSGRAMSRELDKRRFLIETVRADRLDLSGLPPNRRSWLAQTGRQQTNQALARMAPGSPLPGADGVLRRGLGARNR